MRNLIRGLAAALLLATLPIAANPAVFVSVSFGPPLIPVYVAPPMPAPGYIWVPGYWAWSGYDYYWVPGTWVLAPAVGLLWTPGYWGWSGGVYLWHAGYWGPHVGFYGGINYGCGYDGHGYQGGYWQGSTFVVNNTVVNQVSVNRVAFNGGAGGIVARPTPEELRAAHEHHVGMSQAQVRNEHLASADRSLRASVNHGRPPVAATRQPGVFHGAGVVTARNAPAANAAHPVAHESPPVAHEQVHHAATHEPTTHEPTTHEPTQHASAHNAPAHTEGQAQSLARPAEHPPTPQPATPEPHPAAHESHPVAHETHPVAHESHPVAHESHPVAHESHPVVHAQAQHPAHEAQGHGGEQGHGQRPERLAERNHPPSSG
jgi:hypothetical protein